MRIRDNNDLLYRDWCERHCSANKCMKLFPRLEAGYIPAFLERVQ